MKKLHKYLVKFRNNGIIYKINIESKKISMMTKNILSIVSTLVLYSSVSSQHVDVAGDGKLRGRFDLGLQSDTTSIHIGSMSGINQSVGTRSNTFVGAQSGKNITSGRFNSFFGFESGKNNQSGDANSFYGNFSGSNNVDGSNNSFFGRSSGNANISGSANSFFGALSGQLNTTAGGNSFFGTSSGENNISGGNNSFYGYEAGKLNQIGFDNAFFGSQAGRNNTANSNSFFGYLAGRNNTSGGQNAFFGREAGSQNTTGQNNAFFGTTAGNRNIGGDNNSFFGRSAGFNNTTGRNNSFFGFSSGFLNNVGESNSFFGILSGSSNTSGNSNVFMGSGAGQNNNTGSNNTFVGAESGYATTSGDENSFLGALSGVTNDGLKNTFLGFAAGGNNLSGNANVFIGHLAGGKTTTESNLLFIDNTDTIHPLIWGNFDTNALIAHGNFSTTGNISFLDSLMITKNKNVGIGDKNPLAKLSVKVVENQVPLVVEMGTGIKLIVQKNGGLSVGINENNTPANGLYVHGNILYNGSLTHTSDIRFKRNITPLLDPLAALMTLRGVYYQWREQDFPEKEFTNTRQIGLIAQEVEAIFPELVLTSVDGFKSIDYPKLTPILLEAIKELHLKNEDLEKRLKDVEAFLQKIKPELLTSILTEE